jgi:hypothetical protein
MSAERAKTPRYIAGGLLEGGLLPATTYQPPAQISSKIRPKTEIYSPSLYSVATGHDVFSVSSPSLWSRRLLVLLYAFLYVSFFALRLAAFCTFLSFVPSYLLHLHLTFSFFNPHPSSYIPPLSLSITLDLY